MRVNNLLTKKEIKLKEPRWVVGDKQKESQVAKMKLFKPQTNNVNSGITIGEFIVLALTL